MLNIFPAYLNSTREQTIKITRPDQGGPGL